MARLDGLRDVGVDVRLGVAPLLAFGGVVAHPEEMCGASFERSAASSSLWRQFLLLRIARGVARVTDSMFSWSLVSRHFGIFGCERKTDESFALPSLNREG